MNRILMTASVLAMIASPAFAARDQVHIAGSSTVLPYAQIVAEAFAKSNTKLKAPVVESGGVLQKGPGGIETTVHMRACRIPRERRN